MLIEALRLEEKFTYQEKEVARYILENLETVSDLSAEELAKAALASKATVVRLSQKLGLSGYQDFKIKLVAEINQVHRIRQLLKDEPITNQTGYEEILSNLPMIYDKAVTNTRLGFSKSSLLRIRKELLEADIIEFYATGVAYHFAQTVAFKLSTLGLETKVYESLNRHYLVTQKPKRKVIFLLSFTGKNPVISQMAYHLKEVKEVYLIGVFGPYHKNLIPFCNKIIEIPNRDSLLKLDIITSFMAATYVFDSLFALCLSQTYNRQLEASLRLSEYND